MCSEVVARQRDYQAMQAGKRIWPTSSLNRFGGYGAILDKAADRRRKRDKKTA